MICQLLATLNLICIVIIITGLYEQDNVLISAETTTSYVKQSHAGYFECMSTDGESCINIHQSTKQDLFKFISYHVCCFDTTCY